MSLFCLYVKILAVSGNSFIPKSNTRPELAESSGRSPNCRHCQVGPPAHPTASAGTCISTRVQAPTFPSYQCITSELFLVGLLGFLQRATLGLHGVFTTYGCKTAGDTGVAQTTGSHALKSPAITKHTQCFHMGRLCLNHLRCCYR